MPNFVRDCPLRIKEIINPCEKVPGHFVCGTADCWELATKLLDVDFSEINAYEFLKFSLAINKIDTETLNTLIDAYLAQHSRHD